MVLQRVSQGLEMAMPWYPEMHLQWLHKAIPRYRITPVFETCLQRSGNVFAVTSFNASEIASHCTHQVFAIRLPGACEQVSLFAQLELNARRGQEAAIDLPEFCNVFAKVSKWVGKGVCEARLLRPILRKTRALLAYKTAANILQHFSCLSPL